MHKSYTIHKSQRLACTVYLYFIFKIIFLMKNIYFSVFLPIQDLAIFKIIKMISYPDNLMAITGI